MNPLTDYSGRCGSCANFWFLNQGGKIRFRGRCTLRNRVDYHQASQKACKKYVEDTKLIEGQQ